MLIFFCETGRISQTNSNQQLLFFFVTFSLFFSVLPPNKYQNKVLICSHESKGVEKCVCSTSRRNAGTESGTVVVQLCWDFGSAKVRIATSNPLIRLECLLNHFTLGQEDPEKCSIKVLFKKEKTKTDWNQRILYLVRWCGSICTFVQVLERLDGLLESWAAWLLLIFKRSMR